MNVMPLKTGRRGRPPFRRLNGVIVGTSSGGWDFWPAECDLFGRDSVHLAIVSSKVPRRKFLLVTRVLEDGRDCEAVVAFTGKSHIGFNGESYYEFRIVGFPYWVQ